MITNETVRAIKSVYAATAGDTQHLSGVELAEVITESGMLTMHGYPTAEAEIRSLRQKDNYETLKEIVRRVNL